jgi:flagellar motor switch protein FliN
MLRLGLQPDNLVLNLPIPKESAHGGKLGGPAQAWNMPRSSLGSPGSKIEAHQIPELINQSVTRPGRHCSSSIRCNGDAAVSTLDKVSLDIQVVLGTTTMPVHQVLRLGRGAIIELESSEDDEVSILANSFPVAKGTVIVSGNRIAVEVKELLPRLADIR